MGSKGSTTELWSIYNAKIEPDENVRVFPLSNWTELDIWHYIEREKIEVVPLYFAKNRLVVTREQMMILVDDDRLKIGKDERVTTELVRFRTLGCYPLTSAIHSTATTTSEIIDELSVTRHSERQGRAIDKDQIGSMEKKKIEGYF